MITLVILCTCKQKVPIKLEEQYLHMYLITCSPSLIMYTIRLIMYLVIDVIDAIAEYYIYIPIYDYSSLGTVIIYQLDLFVCTINVLSSLYP